jgi:hypothetical protein
MPAIYYWIDNGRKMDYRDTVYWLEFRRAVKCRRGEHGLSDVGYFLSRCVLDFTFGCSSNRRFDVETAAWCLGMGVSFSRNGRVSLDVALWTITYGQRSDWRVIVHAFASSEHDGNGVRSGRILGMSDAKDVLNGFWEMAHKSIRTNTLQSR